MLCERLSRFSHSVDTMVVNVPQRRSIVTNHRPIRGIGFVWIAYRKVSQVITDVMLVIEQGKEREEGEVKLN